MSFDDCKILTHIPDVSDLPNLKELSFKECFTWYVQDLDLSNNNFKILREYIYFSICKDAKCYLCLIRFTVPTHSKRCSNDDSKKFENLTVLNFDNCQLLTRIPDVSDLSNLKKLSFEGCKGLIALDDSIGFLNKLIILKAEGCTKLRRFPPLNLPSLEKLELSYCSSLKNFPEILGKMGNIGELSLSKLAIKELPVSFQNLTELHRLHISFPIYSLCSYLFFPLFSLQKKFENLTELNFDYCDLLEQIPDVSHLPNLEKLSFLGCESLIAVDVSVGFLTKLKILIAQHCVELRRFPPLNLPSLEILELSSCLSLDNFPEILGEMGNIRELHLKELPMIKELPVSFQNLTGLQSLDITGCDFLQLNSSVLTPELTDFMVDGCKERKWVNSKDGEEKFENLTNLNFDNCQLLTRMPDLSDLPNLEKLYFEQCESLIALDDSIGFLNKLKILKAQRCKKLRRFPPLNLPSLKNLELSFCSSLENFPEILGEMGNIRELIGFMTKLKLLSSQHCKKLRRFPPLNLPSLKKLKLSYCSSLENFPEILGKMGNIRRLRLYELTIKELPVSFQNLTGLQELYMECDVDELNSIHNSVGFLTKLKILIAERCEKLRRFPPLNLTSLERLELSYCSSLENFPEILGNMGNIRKLSLLKLPIKELPDSFQNLTGLQELDSNCDFVHLSGNVLTPELTRLYVLTCKEWKWLKSKEGEEDVGSTVSSNVQSFWGSCNLDDEFFSAGFTQLAQVRQLWLVNGNVTFLPERMKEFHHLNALDVSYCENLHEIRGLPPNLKSFRAIKCTSLTSLGSSMLLNQQQLHEVGGTEFIFPGGRIPECGVFIVNPILRSVPLFSNSKPFPRAHVFRGWCRSTVLANSRCGQWRSLIISPKRACLAYARLAEECWSVSVRNSLGFLGEILRVVLQWSGRNPMAPLGGEQRYPPQVQASAESD
ncbi:internalin A [Vigna unguiculata]|uniref:Internalin A n=1 Tax=Vigna unguiculata TaxID=3917 RepID=A0A4D6L2M1_VIGUN|nr:internalin A [Vigna unguiculata]